MKHDDGLNPLDPAVAVQWPLEIALQSQKDTKRKNIIDRDFNGIDVNS